MAARKLRIMHSNEVRAKIQVSQLINRLNDNALGKIELTQGQIKSIEILLRKSIPDLSATELTGANGGAIQTQALSVKYVEPEHASTPGETVEAPSQTLQ
jgi:hypothetical protein